MHLSSPTSHQPNSADRDTYLCYRKEIPGCGEVLFVPDYTEPGIYRAPGGVRIHEMTLQIYNARPCYEHLFTRFAQPMRPVRKRLGLLEML